MGCSYDHPAPSEPVVKLSTDGFVHHKFGITGSCTTCTKCGALVDGSPYSRGYIDLHMTVCPGRKREE